MKIGPTFNQTNCVFGCLFDNPFVIMTSQDQVYFTLCKLCENPVASRFHVRQRDDVVTASLF